MKRASFDQYVNKQDKIISESDLNELWNPLDMFRRKKPAPVPDTQHLGGRSGVNLTPQAGKGDQAKRIMTNPERDRKVSVDRTKESLAKWLTGAFEKNISKTTTPQLVEKLWQALMSPEIAKQQGGFVKTDLDYSVVVRILADSPSFKKNMNALKAQVLQTLSAHLANCGKVQKTIGAAVRNKDADYDNGGRPLGNAGPEFRAMQGQAKRGATSGPAASPPNKIAPVPAERPSMLSQNPDGSPRQQRR